MSNVIDIPLLREIARLRAENDQLDADRLCPWCAGSQRVPAGGWPDANGYERETRCPCGDGTLGGAFEAQRQQLEVTRDLLSIARSEASPEKLKELDGAERALRRLRESACSQCGGYSAPCENDCRLVGGTE